MKVIVGIPKEIKINEQRVSLVPEKVKKLTEKNVIVYIESGAGIYADYTDEQYIEAGGIICNSAEEVYMNANLIIKVKEPLQSEFSLITEKHTIFTFFHFKGVSNLLNAMIESKSLCIAYETVQTSDGKYPILSPMSEIAGEESIIQGIKYMDQNIVPINTTITIIGAGTVGKAAANMAKYLGYNNIYIIDKDNNKLAEMQINNFKTLYSSQQNIEKVLSISNIVIGAIYNTGKEAEKIITSEMLTMMPNDSVFVDVAIDQGGMTEQSYPTTISNPIIQYEHIKLYCVQNIPSRIPNRASIQLSDAIYPYIELMACYGIKEALEKSDELKKGVNIENGNIIHESLL